MNGVGAGAGGGAGAFEKPKYRSELQSGWWPGKAQATDYILGIMLGGLETIPQSGHHCSHFTAEGSGHLAVGAGI